MPIPFVLATIALVWWIALRLGGPGSACLAAGLFVILSTDPYLFGNGANLEHFINFFAVASLALFDSWMGPHRPMVASWVRAFVWVPRRWSSRSRSSPPSSSSRPSRGEPGRERSDGDERSREACSTSFRSGWAWSSIVAVAAAILMARGAGAAAYDDIFRYGRALATDTLPEPNAPPGVIRWITGNADPKGRLPWPFGTTNYLVWWGTASWPFWLVSIPALAYLLLAPRTTPQRRLVAGWTLAAWAQVTLPGLYWPHYYLLPIAGAAIAVAVCWADAASVLGHAAAPDSANEHRSDRAIAGSTAAAPQKDRPRLDRCWQPSRFAPDIRHRARPCSSRSATTCSCLPRS